MPSASHPRGTQEEAGSGLRTYLLAQLKFPQKAILRGLTPQHFLKYMDLLLGEHVLGLKARNKDGDVVASPEFSLVLSYEFQIRRQMVKLCNEGVALHEALKQAMGDTVIKERYFITPNVYNGVANAGGAYATRASGAKRPPSPENPPSWTRSNWKKGNTKGRKGGGKWPKKGRGNQKELHDTTPDGRQICWKWNNPHERCRYDCGRLHVCMACFGNRPYHACKGGPPKDTAGDGGKGPA